jgi:hypothetical protein
MADLGLTPPPKQGPAILIYDLETAPALGWVWSGYKTNVIAYEQDWYLLSFAYKWLGKNGIRFVSIFQDPAFKPDTTNDQWVAARLYALFDQADVLIAHNNDRFDERKANARFLYHDMPPPAPSQTVDTLKESRRYFNEMSHSLKEIGRRHRIGDKTPHHGFQLWRDCMAGDPKAWRLMEKYNRQAVALLEKVYLKLRPWIGAPGKKAHPNMGFWADGARLVCPKCGSGRLHRRGAMHTAVLTYQRFQCKECGGWSKARKSEVTTNPVIVR